MPSIEITEELADDLNKAVPTEFQGPRRTTIQVAMVVADYIRARNIQAMRRANVDGPDQNGDIQP
ncbi:MAG: hypothetical protein ACYTAO_19125 [Planctomycetota bacterium]|jgi:hypothetical protein